MGQDVPILDPGVLQGQVLRTVSDAGILCHEVLYRAGTRLGLHGHENAFFALSLDGCYRESACGRDLECAPRAVVFHPPREEHAVVIGDHPARCFVLEIDVEEVRSRFGAAAPASLLYAHGTPMSALMTRLYAEFRLGDASSRLAMQGLFLEILAFAARNEPRAAGGCPAWLAEVDEILRERFRSRLTLDEIAGEVGVSPARLSVVFRRARQRTLSEEQRRLRIEFACERLRDREASLADIAVDSGFSDQPHFTRTFKQLMAMTPAQYRALF